MLAHKIPEISVDQIQGFLLTTAKICRQTALSDEDKLRLLPALRSWPEDQLRGTMQWFNDKAGLFGHPPELYFNLYSPYAGNNNVDVFKQYKSQDSESIYAVIYDQDRNVVVLNYTSEWFLIGMFQMLFLDVFLERMHFVTNTAALTDPSQASSADRIDEDEDEDLSDYWKRYDDENSEDEVEEEPPQRQVKQDTFRASNPHSYQGHGSSHEIAFYKSYILNFTKDMWSLYEQNGASVDDFACDLLSIFPYINGKSIVRSLGRYPELYRYLSRATKSFLRLLTQMKIEPELFVGDFLLGIVEIDPYCLENII